VLFAREDVKSYDFVNVSVTAALSLYKPGLSILSLATFSDSEKKLAHHIIWVETRLELATHNLIQKQTVMKDQDKIMRGLKS
jgi:hypothetical protein